MGESSIVSCLSVCACFPVRCRNAPWVQSPQVRSSERATGLAIKILPANARRVLGASLLALWQVACFSFEGMFYMRVTAILMQPVAQVNSLPGAVGAEREWKQGPLFGGLWGVGVRDTC